MQPDNLAGTSDFYRLISSNIGLEGYGPYGLSNGVGDPSFCSSSYYPFESSDITDLPQAKALAASKNHREAEKRRRERINSHLNRLRSLLPCNSKTDKASLLAKVIHHVKELKQQAMEISEGELFPSETDEITVLSLDLSGKRSILKASLCCEDRSDLLPDLIETLKSLRLKTLRAEMATVGGRIRNVLIVSGEGAEDNDRCSELSGFLRDALQNLVDGSGGGSCDRMKRRRVVS